MRADRGVDRGSLRSPEPHRGALTLTFALLGDPVGHSISPSLHAAAFQALGVDARYRAVRTSATDLPEAMRQLADEGGGGNVTVPHKRLAALQLDAPSDDAVRSGACNCFWAAPGGGLAGDNTDVSAFAEAVETLPGVRLEGARILLLGAGGGARAVLLAAVLSGAARVDVLNRTASRAREAVAEIVGNRLQTAVLGREPRDAYDLIVNATSLGLLPGDPLPIDLDSIDAPAVFDLVYRRDGTLWTREAARRGRAAADGFEMVVRQAAHSIERWLGEKPPLDAMRHAGRVALSEGSG